MHFEALTFLLHFRMAWKHKGSKVPILQVFVMTWHAMVLHMAFHVKLKKGELGFGVGNIS